MGRRRKARRWPWLRNLLLFSLGLLLTGAGTLLWLLDRQIVRQFEGRRWDAPAQVYARPLELHAGRRLAQQQLEAELQSLGYSRGGELRGPGTWVRRDGEVRVATRGFRFDDGLEPARTLIVRFSEREIVSLSEGNGQPAGLVRLDPPFMGNIFTVHGQDRVILPPDQVPALLLDGLKVVEDRSFDRHIGVDPVGILRALLANIRAGGIRQGGSTLTQQLVRSYFLDNRQTLARKLREAVMAILLELRFGKEDLLNAYVNEIYLGQDGDRAVHGFGLASQFYFGRPLRELDVHEVALLIAVVRGPSWYDPRRNPERARQRRDMVLNLMEQFALLEPAEAAGARGRELGIRADGNSSVGYHPAFMDLVRRQLRSDYREADLLNTGLRILTTLDPGIQREAERQLATQLPELEQARGLARGTLQGAVVVTGTQTPDVMAIVGGRSPRFHGFNRALDARRPVGSLVKPVVYLAALESGRWHLASPLDDLPLEVMLDRRRSWTPRNFDNEFRGSVPLARALAESLNVPTVRLGLDLGVDRVAGLVADLGGTRVPEPYPSLLLGAFELTPLEVAQVYSAFANGGFRTPLRAVRTVIDERGEPLQRYGLRIHPAADPAAVYQVNQAMIEVIERGTGRSARARLRPGQRLAGKTGTSDEARDSWFAGFGSDHLAVVWIGADDNRPTGLTGASGALRVWSGLFAALDDPSWEAPLPGGLEQVWVDYGTGMAVRPRCAPGAVSLALPRGALLVPMPGCEPPTTDTAREAGWTGIFRKH
ncbi:MAG: penicillin-binding protein 1B [Chromatiales bacterium]|nr:penicillin-binding protein 1B [Chromatiales bacterium]